ncbi:MAG TPA: hypothetical protein VGX50_05310 [Longimicrobium sp.]|nr:hypothetical protein [Longimicrobium sp.]
MTLHKAPRAAGDTCRFPMDFGVTWPEKLFPIVRRRIEALQREYDSQIGRQGRVHRTWLQAFVAAFEAG